VKLKKALKADDIVGLVGLCLILAGVLLLVFAGVATRNVAKGFSHRSSGANSPVIRSN
jgi:hypothetical protein